MSLFRHSLNVAHLHEVYENDTNVYMIMELCSGGDLWSHRDIASGCFSEAQAAQIIRAMLRMIAQCHALNVIYRDIKPENFLFTSKDANAHIRAIDFGLACYCEPGQVLTERCGSIYYVAPEIIKSERGRPKPEYGLSSDLWSIGVVAYQLLSGKVPFTDEYNEVPTTKEVFAAIRRKPVDLESGVWENISDGAKEFVSMLLNRDQDARPTAHDALHHRWVAKGGDAPDAPLEGSVVQRLQRFGTYSRFKRAVMQVGLAGLPLRPAGIRCVPAVDRGSVERLVVLQPWIVA
ncbi:hypothetical protein CYMTET_30801, partial [Cymbomonas tetramitiformis]